MSSMKPFELNGGLTTWTVLNLDRAVHDDVPGDGRLTASEVKGRVGELEKERAEAVAMGLPGFFYDDQIDEARSIYNQMKAKGVDELVYLPDALMGQPLSIRRRAVEILENDDLSASGKIDQYAIDHARERYQLGSMPGGTGAMLGAWQKALDEIDEIADVLGLD